MNQWKNINNIYFRWPKKPIALIEMIGGSYLSVNPILSYRRLFNSMLNNNIAVHSYLYVPSFDHQSQANEAWKGFRMCREIIKREREFYNKPYRVGHSLGCKLHLLSPDGGRNSKGLIAISFNNYSAKQSVPLIGQIAPQLGIFTEFSPSPNETLDLISQHYIQTNNLVIQFDNDDLDESQVLNNLLKKRQDYKSNILYMNGNHLTPVSTGVRKKIFGNLSKDIHRIKNLNKLISVIYNFVR